MGHLAIVNSDTIKDISNNHPYISIGGELKKYPYKTISDLFADALAVREGDRIFTWMVNGGGVDGVGFDRVFIASGSVVFDSSDREYPIKIGVKEGYMFDVAVPEEQALDLFRPHLLWNAIGKKSLGRGRSLSHQTLDEDELMLELLFEANKGIRPKSILSAPVFNQSFIPISINMNNISVQGYDVPEFVDLNSVQVNDIVWASDRYFRYEKTLEAYLCENLDTIKFPLCKLLGYPNYFVKWFGNYLPYGVAGKNIDLVCEIEGENKSIIVVVELKRDAIWPEGYLEIIDNQLNNYAVYIANAFKSFRGSSFSIEQVVLGHIPQKALPPDFSQYKNTKWIGYDIDPNSLAVSFTRLL